MKKVITTWSHQKKVQGDIELYFVEIKVEALVCTEIDGFPMIFLRVKLGNWNIKKGIWLLMRKIPEDLKEEKCGSQ